MACVLIAAVIMSSLESDASSLLAATKQKKCTNKGFFRIKTLLSVFANKVAFFPLARIPRLKNWSTVSFNFFLDLFEYGTYWEELNNYILIEKRYTNTSNMSGKFWKYWRLVITIRRAISTFLITRQLWTKYQCSARDANLQHHNPIALVCLILMHFTFETYSVPGWRIAGENLRANLRYQTWSAIKPSKAWIVHAFYVTVLNVCSQISLQHLPIEILFRFGSLDPGGIFSARSPKSGVLKHNG